MSETAIVIIGIAVTAVIMFIVGGIGNKIVDKGENALRKREVKKYNETHKDDEGEVLADRFKH